MKIAIIGTGIAGNVAAYHLSREHEITLFEAGDHLGGHTHTHDIDLCFAQYAVDTGFIVFNDWTYPNFIALLDEPLPTWKYWLPPLVGMAVWPWLFLLLDHLRARTRRQKS